jgi:hypothetical protein
MFTHDIALHIARRAASRLTMHSLHNPHVGYQAIMIGSEQRMSA